MPVPRVFSQLIVAAIRPGTPMTRSRGRACDSREATVTAAGQPRTAVVVGGGIVGLSVAWFLQEHGVEVTVVERAEVGAGASWGNAGWISPGLAIPLPEPSVLRYGFRSLMDPDAPLYVPTKPDPKLW